jgi:hypothetical protein
MGPWSMLRLLRLITVASHPQMRGLNGSEVVPYPGHTEEPAFDLGLQMALPLVLTTKPPLLVAQTQNS